MVGCHFFWDVDRLVGSDGGGAKLGSYAGEDTMLESKEARSETLPQ